MKIAALICVAAFAATTPGCTAPRWAAGKEMVMTELYFGTARPGGTAVSEAEWQAFLDTEITPRFPDGLTVMEGAGQWRTRQGEVVREKTRILAIVHSPTRENEFRLETLRTLYRQRFGQEAVLKVATPVRASF